MEYSSTRSVQSLQSPTNLMSTDNVQSYSESGSTHSNDTGVLSPAQFYHDEKQHQYQNQAPSLNQLLQNNQYGPYGNSNMRAQVPANYHSNYWNLQRNQNENVRMYYNQYQETYPQHINDVTYPKIDKMKSNDHNNDMDSSYVTDESEKSRPSLNDWKLNNVKPEVLSPKDNSNKSENDKKIDKTNAGEMSDSLPMKSESHLNTDYNSNASSAEASQKNDTLYHNSNYGIENKISQTQMKHQSQVGYDGANYGQMMMHPNANYYSQMRYPNIQNNTHNYNNPMVPNSALRPPVVNYPPYMQTSSPAPGYGYMQMGMHQTRAPYNVHVPYAPRSSQSPFPGGPEVYMNGSVPPMYCGPMKDTGDRKEEINQACIVKQETSDSGSTSNKSGTARPSSKSKNVIKSESHPTTPVSNTVPSPSQTSMSSIIDENDDSVSSLGPNDSNMMHHPVSQFNQHQITPNMSQTPSMMYPQPYQNNNSSNANNNQNQIPHSMMGPYPGHMPSQQRPFAPSPSMMPGRQYHHQNDSQINNSCFQKLLELGTEPERGLWVERYLKFMQENNTPLGAVPTVVKQPLDLFRLYHAVRERGGLLNVVKTKRWKEICNIVNVNASASGAYTLRRNYIKCLLDYECRFDRNGVDPGPILQEIQSLSDKKKKSTSRTTGSSSSSTISSGQASQHNSEFSGNPSTPRPTLPPPEFSSPHSFPPGHNPYNNPLHNGAMMHRTPMHYPTQRSPYPPGPYAGPRMMAFNAPSSPMHPPVRYDANVEPPNWSKPVAVNQQQWPSPSSSSNSNSTNPMQMPMSPGTPSNNVSNPQSQQSQPPGDNFEINTKDTGKMESCIARYTVPENNYNSEKDIDKSMDIISKSEPIYYNQPYSTYPGGQAPDGSYDYYHHSKNISANINPPHHPSMQYPNFPFNRQYGSSFRQSGPSSLSFSSYYPPNSNYIYPPAGAPHSSASSLSSSTNNSHHPVNSTNSHSPYYPIGSLQEHTRRMEWKSNYGGMPPPPPPPPAAPSSVSSSQSAPTNGQSTTRGTLPPPNLSNMSSQMSLGGSHDQYHSSMSHCHYPGTNHQSHTASFNQQRPINPQLPSNMITPQNSRHMLQTSATSIPDSMNFLNKSMGSVSSSSIPNNVNNSSSTPCHSRSQLDNVRLTQSYPAQYTYSKSSYSLLKRYDHLFPPNCIEATQPDYSKKRKYCSKDIKTFNPTMVTMALKSGLVAEVSWAINYLNIWSRDDSFFDKLSLKNIMPLFQALIDVWRNSLGVVFGYDRFIDDLELPISLEEKITRSELSNVLNRLEVAMKFKEIKTEYVEEKMHNNVDNLDAVKKHREMRNEAMEDKISSAKEKIVEFLDCGKYSWDRNGLSVKLDLGCKLDSVISTEVDFVNFTMRNFEVIGGGDSEKKGLEYGCAVKSLSDLWEIGGSDSTFHILPPLLSQKKNDTVVQDWHLRLDGYGDYSDNVDPPEIIIKRSRCSSPLCSSSSPPNLLHDDNHSSKSEVVSIGESVLFEIGDAQQEKIMRCVCVSIVIRNLSFVVGNDRIMGSNRTLLVILGRLLLLGHRHSKVEEDALEEWWLLSKWIEDIREHVLVTLVNISSFLDLDACPDGIIEPIIAGLLHWLTCQSAEAEDALPSHRVLGCRRLALECLMRLCVHDKNIDYIISSCSVASKSPGNDGVGDSAIRHLFDFLASSFCYPDVQVVKEMALAVMHYLSMAGDNGLGALYLASAEPSVIGGLISFIEVTESQIRHVVDNMGMEALQARPELMGTSLELLRHSGALLTRMAGHRVNRARFTSDHEMRMLHLVISTVLDQTVAQSISAVLYLLSEHEHTVVTPSAIQTTSAQVVTTAAADHRHTPPLPPTPLCRHTHSHKSRSFLTFDDLSFCEKDDSAAATRPGPAAESTSLSTLPQHDSL